MQNRFKQFRRNIHGPRLAWWRNNAFKMDCQRECSLYVNTKPMLTSMKWDKEENKKCKYLYIQIRFLSLHPFSHIFHRAYTLADIWHGPSPSVTLSNSPVCGHVLASENAAHTSPTANGDNNSCAICADVQVLAYGQYRCNIPITDNLWNNFATFITSMSTQIFQNLELRVSYGKSCINSLSARHNLLLYFSPIYAFRRGVPICVLKYLVIYFVHNYYLHCFFLVMHKKISTIPRRITMWVFTYHAYNVVSYFSASKKFFIHLFYKRNMWVRIRNMIWRSLMYKRACMMLFSVRTWHWKWRKCWNLRTSKRQSAGESGMETAVSNEYGKKSTILSLLLFLHPIRMDCSIHTVFFSLHLISTGLHRVGHLRLVIITTKYYNNRVIKY